MCTTSINCPLVSLVSVVQLLCSSYMATTPTSRSSADARGAPSGAPSGAPGAVAAGRGPGKAVAAAGDYEDYVKKTMFQQRQILRHSMGGLAVLQWAKEFAFLVDRLQWCGDEALYWMRRSVAGGWRRLLDRHLQTDWREALQKIKGEVAPTEACTAVTQAAEMPGGGEGAHGGGGGAPAVMAVSPEKVATPAVASVKKKKKRKKSKAVASEEDGGAGTQTAIMPVGGGAVQTTDEGPVAAVVHHSSTTSRVDDDWAVVQSRKQRRRSGSGGPVPSCGECASCNHPVVWNGPEVVITVNDQWWCADCLAHDAPDVYIDVAGHCARRCGGDVRKARADARRVTKDVRQLNGFTHFARFSWQEGDDPICDQL